MLECSCKCSAKTDRYLPFNLTIHLERPVKKFDTNLMVTFMKYIYSKQREVDLVIYFTLNMDKNKKGYCINQFIGEILLNRS